MISNDTIHSRQLLLKLHYRFRHNKFHHHNHNHYNRHIAMIIIIFIVNTDIIVITSFTSSQPAGYRGQGFLAWNAAFLRGKLKTRYLFL